MRSFRFLQSILIAGLMAVCVQAVAQDAPAISGRAPAASRGSAAVEPSREPFTYQDLQVLAIDRLLDLTERNLRLQRYREAVRLGLNVERLRRQLVHVRTPEELQEDRFLALGERLQRMAAAPNATPEQVVLSSPPNQLEEMAEQGDLDAALELAYRYLHGVAGLEHDAQKGVDLIQPAVAAGDPEALFEFGLAFRTRRMVELLGMQWSQEGPREIQIPPIGGATPMEFELFNQATEAGHEYAPAFVALALIDQGEVFDDEETRVLAERGWRLLREEAKSGNPWAQYFLGAMLLKGFGLPANAGLARTWLERAAGEGLPAAQALYGELLLSDPGTSANPELRREALVNLLMAALQNDMLAQHSLGMKLIEGEDIARAPEAALAWFELAAEAGHLPAAQQAQKLRKESIEPAEDPFVR